MVPGWYWIPTAQSRANLISYLLEPETDDNLITWGWADHVLEVRPKTVDEGLVALAAAMEIDLQTLARSAPRAAAGPGREAAGLAAARADDARGDAAAAVGGRGAALQPVPAEPLRAAVTTATAHRTPWRANQSVLTKVLDASTASPTRGVTTCVPFAAAAFSVRTIGSSQAWYERSKVAQCTGRRSARAEVAMGLHGRLRVHVDVEPGLAVGADLHEIEVDGAEPASDLGEVRTVAGVAAEVDGVPPAPLQRSTSPERGVVHPPAAGVVARGVQWIVTPSSDGESHQSISWICAARHAPALEMGADAEAGVEVRAPAGQVLHGRHVEVVVVIVGDDHGVDAGELRQGNRRRVEARRADRHRRDARRRARDRS